MKNYFYLAASFMLVLSSCKDNNSTIKKEEGFVIKGKMDVLPPSSMAVLSYKQKDSTITDSTLIKNGEFVFKGKVFSPEQAYVSIRHGKEFPEKTWFRDAYAFFIENSNINITSTDSIKKANIEGSILTAQSNELNNEINPLRQKIQDLSRALQGKPQDEAYMSTVDTIKASGKRVEVLVRKFIEDHRDSYIALRNFANYELGYNFNPNVADAEFNKFTSDVRNTPLGEKVLAKINLAKKTSVGEQAMDFTQTTIVGKPFTLSSLKGKYVLVDFWASWCVPCRKENPFVVKAYNKFKDENFEIVGVSLDEKKKNWEYAVEKDGLPWIHVSDLKGWKNEVAKTYGITAVPQNFLIDKDGVIIAKNLKGEDLTTRLSEIFSKN